MLQGTILVVFYLKYCVLTMSICLPRSRFGWFALPLFFSGLKKKSLNITDTQRIISVKLFRTRESPSVIPSFLWWKVSFSFAMVQKVIFLLSKGQNNKNNNNPPVNIPGSVHPSFSMKLRFFIAAPRPLFFLFLTTRSHRFATSETTVLDELLQP